MVTGASTAELALILVDARHGVVEQTRRHLAVTGLLGVRHVALAVNKMDLVDWDETAFKAIVVEFEELAARFGIEDVVAVPVSALLGDNVVDRSEHATWYSGPTLLEHLEAVPVGTSPDTQALRLPVQYVVRPRTPEHPDYRGYAGRLASGVVRPGDEVVVLPSGRRTAVVGIDRAGADGEVQELDVAFAPQSVVLRLADDLDISRGDLIAAADAPGLLTRSLTGTVAVLSTARSASGTGCCSGSAHAPCVRSSTTSSTSSTSRPCSSGPRQKAWGSTRSAGSAFASQRRSPSTTTASCAAPAPSSSSTRRTARPLPRAWPRRRTAARARASDGGPGYPLTLDLRDRRVLVVGGGRWRPAALRGCRGRRGRRGRRALGDGGPARPAHRRTGGLARARLRRRRPGPGPGVAGAHRHGGPRRGRGRRGPRRRRADLVRARRRRLGLQRVDSGGRARFESGAAEGITVAVTAGGDPRRAVAVRDAVAAALDSGTLPVRRVRPAKSAGRPPAAGRVALVGGGPGADDLITVRGRALLAAADVVVTDRLGPRGLLATLGADVEVVDVGKTAGNHPVGQDRINEVLVEHALAGRNVVRLKGGDPFVLGRGGEEALHCAAHGVPVEVVPGVTSAVSVPAAAGIPVTHRGITASFVVASAHEGSDVVTAALKDAPADATLVLLMGVTRLADTAAGLIRSGRSADTRLPSSSPAGPTPSGPR